MGLKYSTSQGIPEEDMNSGLKYSVSGRLDLAAMPIKSMC